jgi:hypothetical protein
MVHKIELAGVGVAAAFVLAAGAYAVTSGGQSEDSKGDQIQDPCLNLSDEECMALQQKMSADFDARLAAWVTDFNDDDLDLRSLRKGESSADYAPPLETLEASVNEAEVILVGTANTVSFEGYYAFVVVDIEQTLKGSVSKEITFVQGGGPRPDPEWKRATLVEAPADPLLLPGDQAVLFLRYYPEPGWYEAQPWTGQYRLNEDGTISANEFNPFRREVDGLILDEFLDLIETANAGAKVTP